MKYSAVMLHTEHEDMQRGHAEISHYPGQNLVKIITVMAPVSTAQAHCPAPEQQGVRRGRARQLALSRSGRPGLVQRVALAQQLEACIQPRRCLVRRRPLQAERCTLCYLYVQC